jgi:hypothetical protein
MTELLQKHWIELIHHYMIDKYRSYSTVCFSISLWYDIQKPARNIYDFLTEDKSWKKQIVTVFWKFDEKYQIIEPYAEPRATVHTSMLPNTRYLLEPSPRLHYVGSAYFVRTPRLAVCMWSYYLARFLTVTSLETAVETFMVNSYLIDLKEFWRWWCCTAL